ncbi:MAG TPA: hypothetical protein VMI31_07380 [Fimbriimonadaceae bacterium]|nr:hypothetical protein [Fimbriimonadaceae bacterium]
MIAKPIRMLGWVLSLAVIATLVTAVLVVGSPAEARKRHADDERASDLSTLASSVRSYYTGHKKLPAKLEDCASYTYEGALTDAETGAPYGYRVLDRDRFQLSAVFETDTSKEVGRTSYYGYTDNIGVHGKGLVWFTLSAKGSP